VIGLFSRGFTERSRRSPPWKAKSGKINLQPKTPAPPTKILVAAFGLPPLTRVGLPEFFRVEQAIGVGIREDYHVPLRAEV
jgi:hypothetical protein